MAGHVVNLRLPQTARWRLAQFVTVALLAAGTIAADPAIAQADGGKLQTSERVGPWIISLFTSPTPPAVGPVDISALVQDAKTSETVTDASIRIVAREANGGFTVRKIATRAEATNKLFQAAWLDLPTPGLWTVTAEASRGETVVETTFDVWVAEPAPPWFDLALWVVWPCAPIGLYATAQVRGRRKHVLH